MAHAVLEFTFWYGETRLTNTGGKRIFLFIIEGEINKPYNKEVTGKVFYITQPWMASLRRFHLS